MDKPSYDSYTIEELQQVLRSIDRERFPDRVSEAQRFLDERLNDPLSRLEYNRQADFFNTFVPKELVTTFWLKFLIGTILAALVIAVPLGLLTRLILDALDYAPLALTLVGLWINLVVYMVASWWIFRRLLGQSHGEYEITIRKRT